MEQVECLVVIDLQPTFNPPPALVAKVSELARRIHSVATVERHDESITPFQSQIGWSPGDSDDSLVVVDRVFIKHGYLPPPDMIGHLQSLGVKRTFVCGMQADTCVLAAGFALFDAGLRPTLLADLVVGSSLDRSGELGARLWRHHFKAVMQSAELQLT